MATTQAQLEALIDAQVDAGALTEFTSGGDTARFSSLRELIAWHRYKQELANQARLNATRRPFRQIAIRFPGSRSHAEG